MKLFAQERAHQSAIRNSFARQTVLAALLLSTGAGRPPSVQRTKVFEWMLRPRGLSPAPFPTPRALASARVWPDLAHPDSRSLVRTLVLTGGPSRRWAILLGASGMPARMCPRSWKGNEAWWPGAGGTNACFQASRAAAVSIYLAIIYGPGERVFCWGFLLFGPASARFYLLRPRGEPLA